MEHRALVIEDNEQNMHLLTVILEKNGYEVIKATDGRRGIELAESFKPSIILLDIQLPVMDGYAVATELRRNPAIPDVPIIAVTSYAMVGDRERILASGCTGHIEKPIDPASFIAEIEQYLPPAPSVEGDGPCLES